MFSSFCKKNNPEDFEVATEYFTVFGGLDIKVDTTKPLNELIEEHILKKYKYLRNIVSDLTKGDSKYHAILSASVLGDGRTNSSFKRCNISFDDGMDCVEELCDMGVIKLERSAGDVYVSDKILINTPFLRFWFAFVSPVFKGIRDGDFEEFYKVYNNRKAEFTDLVFNQLSHEFVKQYFVDDKIYNITRYWDDDEKNIDLVAKSKSGKIIVGSCKYINSKLKKSELTKLNVNCEIAKIKADIFVFFAKKGYSSELKSMKSDSVKLFTCKSFKGLID